MEDPLLPLSTSISPSQPTATSRETADTPYQRRHDPALRIIAITLLACLSLWANHEASKGFDVLIRNEAGTATRTGKQFNTLLVSNGHASRLVTELSESLERTLFPDRAAYPRKPVGRVTVHLVGFNLSSPVSVTRDEGARDAFTLFVSATVADELDVRAAAAEAIYRGMARVWLWDGDGTVPESFVDAMVDLMAASAGFHRFNDRTGAGSIMGLLRSCDSRNDRFVARLNRAMRNGWDGMVVKLTSNLQPSKDQCDDFCGSLEQKMFPVGPAGSEPRPVQSDAI